MRNIVVTAVIWKWKTTIIMTVRAAVHTKGAGSLLGQKPVRHFSGNELTIEQEVLVQISDYFCNGECEAGGILGSRQRLDYIDAFEPIPAKIAEKYYYVPDVEVANTIISKWSKKDICFCGFIHSHVTDKMELSDGDMKFAEQLFKSFRLPVIWFGLRVLTSQNQKIKFYMIHKKNEKIRLSPVTWKEGNRKN